MTLDDQHNDLVGDAEYYAGLAGLARAQYSPEYAAGYRESDDEGLGGPTHNDQGDLLTEVSASFGRPIAVLDLGCGTGRYWHHLRNVHHLIGVDVSPDMLRQAEQPVCESVIKFPRTLLCADLAEVSLPDGAFDLVYAIGVLGRYMPLDDHMVTKIWRMLKPGGRFVVTTMDRETYGITTWKRRIVQAVLPMLPAPLQRTIQMHMRDFSLTQAQIRALFPLHAWSPVTITRRGKRKFEWVCRVTKN